MCWYIGGNITEVLDLYYVLVAVHVMSGGDGSSWAVAGVLAQWLESS